LHKKGCSEEYCLSRFEHKTQGKTKENVIVKRKHTETWFTTYDNDTEDNDDADGESHTAVDPLQSGVENGGNSGCGDGG
jgi:hypothetical protein